MSTTTPNSRRTQATEQFERGKAAVCAVFDAVDHLRATLIAISISSTGPDPLRAADDVAEALPRLRAAVAALRQAADAAIVHASKTDLAAHADTKAMSLFPRPTNPVGHPSRLPALAPMSAAPTIGDE